MTKNHILRIIYKKTRLSLNMIEISEHLLWNCLRFSKAVIFKGFQGPVIFAEAFPIRQSQYNMRNYSYFAMPCARTVNGLESLSYIVSKLWDSIPSIWKRYTLLMNLKVSLKLGNLICTHADFAKFIYKTLDIFSQ